MLKYLEVYQKAIESLSASNVGMIQFADKVLKQNDLEERCA